MNTRRCFIRQIGCAVVALPFGAIALTQSSRANGVFQDIDRTIPAIHDGDPVAVADYPAYNIIPNGGTWYGERVFAYDRVLSESEIRDVNAYLKAKWKM